MPQPDSEPPDDEGPDTEATAEQVFIALADPSRRAILAALASGGPATATDLARRSIRVWAVTSRPVSTMETAITPIAQPS